MKNAPEPASGASLAKVIKPCGAHRDRALTRQARQLGFASLSLKASEIFFLRGETDTANLRSIVTRLLDDALGEAAHLEVGTTAVPAGRLVIEVARRAGVTDRVATQLAESAARSGCRIEAATGSRFEMTGAGELSEKDLRFLVHNLICNPVIETWSFGEVQPGFTSATTEESSTVEIVPLCGRPPEVLARVNN